MFAYNQARIWIATTGVLFFLAIATVNGQQPQAQKGKAEAQAQPRRPVEPNETYVLQTYEVGDLIISVQDHPYSDELLRGSSKAVESAVRGSGGGFGGGGGGGGQFSVPDGADNRKHDRSKLASKSTSLLLCQFGGGGGRAEGGTSSASSTGVSMDDLIRVLVSTVAADSWAQNGGEGKVEPIGTALVVYQTPAIHQLIEKLLDQIRSPAGRRNTLTIDARWLMLTSDDLDSLISKDSTSLLEVDRKALAPLTRRNGSIRGLINCFSGQLVYLTSGTKRNVVSGWIPVVGTIRTGNGAVSLVAAHRKPRIQFVAETLQGGRESKVGYQPIVGSSNLGAVLEIRPTMIGGSKSAIVELRSTLTGPSERGGEPARKAAADGIAPAVDRIAVETLELATTLRMPLGKPILVGGLTYLPGSGKTGDESDKAERQQLYLVLEIR